jgi:group I intron endonuclease
MKTGIYIIRNVINGKVYVGSAVDVAHRWVVHRLSLERGDHHSIHLQRAWDEYGSDAFEFALIESVAVIGELLSREQHWLDYFQAAKSKYGYNVLLAAGAIPSWRGREKSPEHRTNIGAALCGIQRSEKTKAKVRLARSRQAPASLESREKNRQQMLAQWTNPQYRQKMSRVAKRRWAGAARTKRSAELKQLWQDGVYDNRPCDHEQLSRAARLREKEPALRAKQSESAKRRWTNPDERLAKSESSKALWLDPHYRTKVAGGQQAGRERKKAAKALEERPKDELLN